MNGGKRAASARQVANAPAFTGQGRMLGPLSLWFEGAAHGVRARPRDASLPFGRVE